MIRLVPAALPALCLLLPAVAFSVVETAPNYTRNNGNIISGGGSAAGVPEKSTSGAAIGQSVYIRAAGSSSQNYIAKASALASHQSGGIHSGDINGDGKVNIADALLALKSGIGLVALNTQQSARGDVGPLANNVPVGNGRIDIEDALLILRKAVGMDW